ncbi:hypothetical protein ACFL6M_04985 [Candidatus Eisenbacteria bacterium]|uniref:Uncharacterized protein n=1 Tax=Eiseniibacteriota bacterium TaxID=2212470 RepID=A0ABV6YKT1_UNCEI
MRSQLLTALSVLLPLLALSSAGAQDPVEREAYFFVKAGGGGDNWYKAWMEVSNISDSPQTVTIEIFDQNGNPINPQLETTEWDIGCGPDPIFGDFVPLGTPVQVPAGMTYELIIPGCTEPFFRGYGRITAEGELRGILASLELSLQLTRKWFHQNGPFAQTGGWHVGPVQIDFNSTDPGIPFHYQYNESDLGYLVPINGGMPF